MFKLFFATPDKKIANDAELEEITLPAFAGELNILPGHVPLMTTLSAGILKYKLLGAPVVEMAISWGYCQISSDGVTVLTETAVTADEIQTKVVEQRLQDYEKVLATETLDEAQWQKTKHEIARLQAEINLAAQK